MYQERKIFHLTTLLHPKSSLAKLYATMYKVPIQIQLFLSSNEITQQIQTATFTFQFPNQESTGTQFVSHPSPKSDRIFTLQLPHQDVKVYLVHHKILLAHPHHF